VSPELSRRFRALKLWLALKIHGADAFANVIAQNVATAQVLAALVDDSDDFERLAPAPLSIVCFRHLPAGIRGEHALNDFNRRLMLEVQRGGDAYLSNAMLGDAFALRACIVNHRTDMDDPARLLNAIRRAAERL
jgi:glutamate/tyrosine decarboxylase-like PLP-dependent enzyme